MARKIIKKYELNINKNKNQCDWKHKCHASGCGFYFLGFIGAAVYYIQSATSFWSGVLGVLKAIVWPAFLVHGILKFIGIINSVF